MTENTNNTPKTPTLHALITEEQANAPYNRAFMMSDREAKMTPEEREEYRQREEMRRRISTRSWATFEEALVGCPSPRYVLAMPFILANNYELGTNAVMRVIMSDEVSEERIAHVDELCNKIWHHGSRMSPRIRSMFQYFNRFDYGAAGIKDVKLTECYWLMEMAAWMGRLDQYFSNQVSKAFAVQNSVEELDFTRVLNYEVESDRELIIALAQQYGVLEQVLARI